ncbi:MAG: type III pantothenate kinase [bacterium]
MNHELKISEQEKKVLVIDIGNTNTHFGIYAGEELKVYWSVLNNIIKKQQDIILLRLKTEMSRQNIFTIHQCTISCVVPSLRDVFSEIILNAFGFNPLFIEYHSVKIPIFYNNLSELGVDRIINALAAVKLYSLPCIIVDFGTATTFDVVSDKGEFIGGVIAPGIGVSMETLWTKTEKLPSIEIDVPKSVIGKNTVDCMKSGIFYGFIGQVNEIIRRIQEELIYKEDINVIATGGLSNIIGPYSKYIRQIDSLLTLKGLKILTT